MGWLLRLVTGSPTGGRGPPTVLFYVKSKGVGPDLRKWRGPRMVALRLCVWPLTNDLDQWCIYSHQQSRQCRGPKTVKGAQSDPNHRLFAGGGGKNYSYSTDLHVIIVIVTIIIMSRQFNLNLSRPRSKSKVTGQLSLKEEGRNSEEIFLSMHSCCQAWSAEKYTWILNSK